MGVLHLYADVEAQAVAAGASPTTDHGLRFAKFFGGWDRKEGCEPEPDRMAQWLKGGQALSRAVGDTARLDEAVARMARLATVSIELFAVSHLLTDLGASHPSENGFPWHPTLAVPYLKGSGLKQIARLGAAARGAHDAETAGLFGSPAGGGRASFLDALPITRPVVTLEQITNHYPGYYGGPNPALGAPRKDLEQPADWYDPIPVSLLAVEASLAMPQRFLVGVRAGDWADAETALCWLIEGLDRCGFGAKTKLGFGRLVTESRLTELRGEEAAFRGDFETLQARLAAATLVHAEALRAARLPDVGNRVADEDDEYRVLAVTGKRLTLQRLGDRMIIEREWPGDMRIVAR